MQLISTRGSAPPVDLATALIRGLAPDGGLYMPSSVTPLSPTTVTGFAGRPLPDIATTVLGQLAGDALDADTTASVVNAALDFPIPLVSLEPGIQILELFHGPTLAFKDVAARVMARLLPWADQRTGRIGDGPLTVLTATSGDTGGAVAQAFFGVEGVRVAVLYPRGRVTPVQERQITTLGGNVLALSVDGSFDDCQRLVKTAFADEAMRTGFRLTSANSINIGRLLPQAVYYFHAEAARRAGGDPEPPLFCTPSGNFGNLTAGLLADRLGLPNAGFLAATNRNDVVPAYLRSGHYDPRPSVATLSSAMDVGDPSNFARMRHLFDDDLARIRRRVDGARVDEDTTRATIRQVYETHGRILDPHTAVGVAALRRLQAERPVPGIVLATAHAAKFAEVVEPLIGEAVPMPAALAELEGRTVHARPLADDLGALRRAMAAWAVD